MQLEPDNYFPEVLTDWAGIKDDQAFYVEDGQLILYFALYDIAPYCNGIPEFKIPLAMFGDGVKSDLIQK